MAISGIYSIDTQLKLEAAVQTVQKAIKIVKE